MGHLACLVFISCFVKGDPEHFIRHYESRLLFKQDNQLLDTYVIKDTFNEVDLSVQGLISARHSNCGISPIVTLRVISEHDKYLNLSIMFDKIDILYEDKIVPFSKVDTFYNTINNNKLSSSIDIYFGIDTCKTLSGILFKRDTINPKVVIKLDSCITINSKAMKINDIDGYR